MIEELFVQRIPLPGKNQSQKNGHFSGLRTMTAITTVFATEYPFSSSFFEQLG